jgi:hypothetical protein
MLELASLAPSVHTVPSWIRLGPGFHLPLRSTILGLAGGELAVVSPVAFDDAVAARIDRLGGVRHLVAPNLLHHLHLGAAAARWPDARVHGAAGLRSKRPDLHLHATLEGPTELHPDLLAVPVEGVPRFSEYVLLHRPSRTLVVTDLVFHVHESRGWMTPWILRMVGARVGTLGQSRAWPLAAADQRALAASLRRILALDFDRLVMAHGEPIERGAKERLEAAFCGRLGRAALSP